MGSEDDILVNKVASWSQEKNEKTYTYFKANIPIDIIKRFVSEENEVAQLYIAWHPTSNGSVKVKIKADNSDFEFENNAPRESDDEAVERMEVLKEAFSILYNVFLRTARSKIFETFREAFRKIKESGQATILDEAKKICESP